MKKTQNSIDIYGVEKSSLSEFVTKEDEKRKGGSRIPGPQFLLYKAGDSKKEGPKEKKPEFYNEQEGKILFSSDQGEYGYLENSFLC
jgi:hypothetical protein